MILSVGGGIIEGKMKGPTPEGSRRAQCAAIPIESLLRRTQCMMYRLQDNVLESLKPIRRVSDDAVDAIRERRGTLKATAAAALAATVIGIMGEGAYRLLGNLTKLETAATLLSIGGGLVFRAYKHEQKESRQADEFVRLQKARLTIARQMEILHEEPSEEKYARMQALLFNSHTSPDVLAEIQRSSWFRKATMKNLRDATTDFQAVQLLLDDPANARSDFLRRRLISSGELVILYKSTLQRLNAPDDRAAAKSEPNQSAGIGQGPRAESIAA